MKKVMVPQHVADAIELLKIQSMPPSVYGARNLLVIAGKGLAADWIRDNESLFMEAFNSGYEVGEPVITESTEDAPAEAGEKDTLEDSPVKPSQDTDEPVKKPRRKSAAS